MEYLSLIYALGRTASAEEIWMHTLLCDEVHPILIPHFVMLKNPCSKVHECIFYSVTYIASAKPQPILYNIMIYFTVWFHCMAQLHLALQSLFCSHYLNVSVWLLSF